MTPLPPEPSVLDSLPTPIALPLAERPFVAVHRRPDAAEIATRFLTIALLGDVRRQLSEIPDGLRRVLSSRYSRHPSEPGSTSRTRQ